MTLNQNAMCLTRISGPRQDQSSHREKHGRWQQLLYSSSHANDATFHSRQFDDRKKRFWRGREMIAEDATGTRGSIMQPGAILTPSVKSGLLLSAHRHTEKMPFISRRKKKTQSIITVIISPPLFSSPRRDATTISRAKSFPAFPELQ